MVFEDKISVIVPVYNAELKIEQTVSSITGQSYPNLEIILLDDGSTDKSYEICMELQSKDDRILVFSHSNMGVSRTRNRGLKEASGNYIIFCDSDDTMQTNMIEILYRSLIKNKSDIAICGYSKIYTDSKETPILKRYSKAIKAKWKKGETKINLDKRILLEIFPCNCNKLYSTELIRSHDAQYIPEISFGEDLIFCYQNATKANNISLVEDTLYNYFLRDNYSLSSIFHERLISDSIIIVDSILEFLEEWGTSINKLEVISKDLYMYYLDKYIYYLSNTKISKEDIIKYNEIVRDSEIFQRLIFVSDKLDSINRKKLFLIKNGRIERILRLYYFKANLKKFIKKVLLNTIKFKNRLVRRK